MFKSSCKARSIARKVTRLKTEERKCTEQHKKLVVVIKSLDETISHLSSKNFKAIGRSPGISDVTESCKSLQLMNETFIASLLDKKSFLIRELKTLKNYIYAIRDSIENAHCSCAKCMG